MNEKEIFKDAKVLLVDDNQINLFVLNKVFEQLGIEADCVPSGTVAIRKASKKHYDIIFLDHMMPELDGVETLAKMLELPDFDTPVVALTANTGDDLEKLYKDAGFAEYMMKPADVAGVHELLVKYLIADRVYKAPERKNSDDGRRDLLREAGFDVIDKLLDAGMSIEEYEEILRIFMEESDVKLPDCNEYCEKRDMKNYAIIVHGLKNDAAMISDASLSEHAKKHEIESKADNVDYVTAEWPVLKEHWNDTLTRIKSYFEKTE